MPQLLAPVRTKLPIQEEKKTWLFRVILTLRNPYRPFLFPVLILGSLVFRKLIQNKFQASDFGLAWIKTHTPFLKSFYSAPCSVHNYSLMLKTTAYHYSFWINSLKLASQSPTQITPSFSRNEKSSF